MPFDDMTADDAFYWLRVEQALEQRGQPGQPLTSPK